MTDHLTAWDDREESLAANGVAKRTIPGMGASLVRVVVPAGMEVSGPMLRRAAAARTAATRRATTSAWRSEGNACARRCLARRAATILMRAAVHLAPGPTRTS